MVSAGLNNAIVGGKIIHFRSVPSTNTVARKAAGRGATEGLVVLADHQSAGRGRRERTWISPDGSVAISVLLRPRITLLPSLIMAASLSVRQAVEAVTGLEARIKWPNDVLVNGKKVCGILIENEVRGESAASVIGIGINVNVAMRDYPELADLATSLSGESRKPVSRLEIVRQVLVELDRRYRALKSGLTLCEEWRQALDTLGRPVKVIWGDAVIEGVAEDVASDGALILRLPDGVLTSVVAGEVSLRHQPE